MVQFDANLVTRNARTDVIMDKLVKSMRQNNRPRAESNLADNVLRPYAKVLNECELRNVEPVSVNEATVSVMAAMCTELMVRTIPRGNAAVVQAAVQDMLDDFRDAFLSSISANFNVQFELAGDRQPPAPLLHS